MITRSLKVNVELQNEYNLSVDCRCHRSVEVFDVSTNSMIALRKETIWLCYICKKIAFNVERFVHNVQSNQFQFGRAEIIADSTVADGNKIVPLVNLSKEKLHSLDSRESKYLEETDSEIFSSKDIKIKVELKNELTTENLEEVIGDSEFQQSNLKEEDDALHDAMKEESDFLENINLKLLSKQLKEKKNLENRKSDIYKNSKKHKSKDCFVTVLHITKEQFDEEKQNMMKDPKYVNSVYRCVDCIKGFIFKESYDKHMLKHSKTMGEFECDVCKQRMSTMEKLLSHQKYHKIRYKCTACELVRISRLTITDHYRACHMQDSFHYKCPQCDKTFKRQISLKKHISYSHINRGRSTCSYCHKSYANKEVLKGHLIRAHPSEVSSTSAPQHVCAECGLGFRAPSQLRNHMIKHSDNRNFYCVECDRSFKSDAALKQHLKVALPHVNYMELPLKCTHCDKRFSIRRDLERHVNRVHLNIKPHQCDKCDKAYINGWSLREHKSYAHDGRKRPLKFPCPYCDKIFDRNATCKAHVRTHTGERPYGCVRCGARFSQASVLATHVRLVHLHLTRDGRPKHAARTH
ncbi:unnamed protein product [Danaus chrysippus]|uniref:(African queen) hypothetical protein n=1 Tax=Danaus chrysippus TaxID=151541 RepID=A0A8J2VTS7_9NEOP|nr:unnamed protein product [Danaus chrysippus]